MINETTDESLANIKQSSLVCTSLLKVDKNAERVERTVNIPILTNSVVVKPGDELLVFNPKLLKEPMTIEPASQLAAGKRKPHGGVKEAASKAKRK